MRRVVYLNPALLVHRSNMSSISAKNEATYSIAELAREFGLTPRAGAGDLRIAQRTDRTDALRRISNVKAGM
jgi:phage terminase small subunit